MLLFFYLLQQCFTQGHNADRIMSRTARSRPQPTKTFVVIIVKSIKSNASKYIYKDMLWLNLK